MSPTNLSNAILLVLASGKKIFGISPHWPPLCNSPQIEASHSSG